MAAGFVCEVVMTAVFLFGLTLTLIHLISIPVTDTPVNPARSTGPAVFIQGWALAQIWLFWVAPLVGAACGALAYRFVTPGWTRGPGDAGGPGT
jgi:aquaporin Z